ncbi:MAG: transposase family protein [Elusimicrobiales bacterium]
MTHGFKMAYLDKIRNRYHKCGKRAKKAILDEFCRVCGYSRKHAINLLNKPDSGSDTPRRKRGSGYDPIADIARRIWESAGYPWSLRLKEILRLWLPAIRKRFKLSANDEQLLLSVSPRTLDRLLSPHKRRLKRRLYGRTKPGTLLKHNIPVRTDFWDVKGPGYLELDTVSHSGANACGNFIYTLNVTDIFTGWVESRAVMGKGEQGIRAALEEILAALPFAARAIDSDNGGEFINHHLWRYCFANGLEFTRSRPYKKDDNAHIEQKNWTHVRKLIGWDRYDSEPARALMNRLYKEPLRLWMNLFQPSVKLVKAERRGSRLLRKYDKPQTPLDRLAAHDKKLGETLTALRAKLDPF